ncbi:MAG: hypothetical protein JJT85_07670 [Chromatiales bacterium]|nr:hypothetical protein [Chromatiales bacterium]
MNGESGAAVPWLRRQPAAPRSALSPGFPGTGALRSLLLIPLMAAGCGGGGGGEGGSENLPLRLDLSPASWTMSSVYPESAFSIMVTATVTGTVSGEVVVRITDEEGVISPDVSIMPWGDEYWVTLRSVATLAAGEYSGELLVNLCSDFACSRKLGAATLPYEWLVSETLAVSALSPPFVESGSDAIALTVTGQGFMPRSVVRWNGSVRETTFVSDTELIAQIPANTLRTARYADVDVRTQLGGIGIGLFTSEPVQFAVNNHVPVVTALSEPSVPAGTPTFDLVLTGQGLVHDSIVTVNGAAGMTFYRSGTELAVRMLAEEMVEDRELTIAVVNPEPGGGTSEPEQLTVMNPEPLLTTTDPGYLEAGCGALLLAINGSGFKSGTVLLWDGEERPTEVLSGERMQTTLSAGDLAVAREVEVAARSLAVESRHRWCCPSSLTGPQRRHQPR